jgi:hypothetical protein
MSIVLADIRILFNLYYAYLSWEEGGEYLAFYHLVHRMIKAWRAVGFELVFVFDGMFS